MPTLEESLLIDASLAEVWDYYFEPRGWPAWVDGFHAVSSAQGYPGEGGTLVWRSNPAGRGTVTERVLEHQPRRRHLIEFSDPESQGELLTRFEIEGERTRVTLSVRLRPAAGRPVRLAHRAAVRPRPGARLASAFPAALQARGGGGRHARRPDPPRAFVTTLTDPSADVLYGRRPTGYGQTTTDRGAEAWRPEDCAIDSTAS